MPAAGDSEKTKIRFLPRTQCNKEERDKMNNCITV